MQFRINLSSEFNFKEQGKGHVNGPGRSGDALYPLDFSGYLMADKKYIGEDISIIELIP